MMAINCSYNLLEVFILLQLQSTLNGITCFFVDDVACEPRCPKFDHKEFIVTPTVRLQRLPLPIFSRCHDVVVASHENTTISKFVIKIFGFGLRCMEYVKVYIYVCRGILYTYIMYRSSGK